MLIPNVRLQVKDIITYLEPCDHIIIEQLDAFLEGTPHEDDSEEIYNGSVMDVPWYIMDYYLANDADCGALSICDKNCEKEISPSFFLMVMEDKDRLDKRYN